MGKVPGAVESLLIPGISIKPAVSRIFIMIQAELLTSNYNLTVEAADDNE